MAAASLPIEGLHFGPRSFLAERAEALEKLQWRHFELRPLSPVVGAEVHGLDLRAPGADAIEELTRAFYAWRVLFFRDQALAAEQQLAFARNFGELEEHPFLPASAAHREIVQFAKDEAVKGVENNWHSDVSWREKPSLGAVLRAVEAPELGGDTLFADMTLAWRGLSDEMKQRIEGRTAVHDFLQAFGHAISDEAELARKRREFPEARHPLVRTHPVTGDRILYLNRLFTTRIEGMEAAESRRLIETLCREAEVPEYQCRFRWRPNSVAFWDNRALQHYAASDYWPKRRVMERVAIVGEKPF